MLPCITCHNQEKPLILHHLPLTLARSLLNLYHPLPLLLYCNICCALTPLQRSLSLLPKNLYIVEGPSGSWEQPMFQWSTLMFSPLCLPCKHPQRSLIVPFRSFFCDAIRKMLPCWGHSLPHWQLLTCSLHLSVYTFSLLFYTYTARISRQSLYLLLC